MTLISKMLMINNYTVEQNCKTFCFTVQILFFLFILYIITEVSDLQACKPVIANPHVASNLKKKKERKKRIQGEIEGEKKNCLVMMLHFSHNRAGVTWASQSRMLKVP